MDERDHYYFNYLTGKYKGDYIAKHKFSLYIKSLFFNNKSYKWEPTLYKEFIKRNELDYNLVYKVISTINPPNHTIKNKGYNVFLSKINKYNNKTSISKIQIPTGYSDDFIKDLNQLRKKHFKITNKDFIDFIVNNFDIDYSKSTLTKYYSEKKFES